MRKICYEINPDRFSADMERFELTFSEESAYRCMLDIMWKEDKQFKIKDNTEELSVLIGCDEAIVKTMIDKLSSGSSPLVKIEMDLESLEFSLFSVELKKQIVSFVEQKRLERDVINPIRKENSSRLKPIVEKIRNAEKGIETATTRYLTLEERICEEFIGWLPTKNFDANGQTYHLPSDFVGNLEKDFPGKDIQFHLSGIFKWMMKNPNRRTTIANMNDFIMKWLERSEMDNNSDMSFDELLNKAAIEAESEIDSDEEFA